MIDISGITPIKQLFHNVWIDVYPKRVHINEIKFWRENARNILDFNLLTTQEGKELDKIPERKIINFLSSQPRLKLDKLAESIKKNGVRVPLIILQDGILLDGNRRYFACKLIQYEAEDERKKLPEVLESIQTYVITAIDERNKQKVLAEANFVDDYRVEWDLDVRANVISAYYSTCKKAGMSEDKIYAEIFDVYSVEKREVDDYISALKIANEFIRTGDNNNQQLKRRTIVQNKFLYFWEFSNKALRGRSALEKDEIPKVKGLFFLMMFNDKFKNFKQVEPMIRSVRDEYSWNLLVKSKGTKIDMVEAIYKESKAVKSVEDKFRNFSKWLEKLTADKLTKATYLLIEKIIKKLQGIISS